MVKTVKKPQLLTVHPDSELEFVGDPTQVNTSQVLLRNNTDLKIGFKVLTNAPHLLFVRPASEVILPYSQCTISVMVQPPTPKELTNFRHHKLMIQSIIVQPESTESIDKFITRNANSAEIMETKLVCSFKTAYVSELEFPLSDENKENSPRGNEMPGFGDDIMKFQASLQQKSTIHIVFSALVVILTVVVVLLAYVYYFKSEEEDEEERN